MSLQALDAGKHVMCTVPMATTIEDCQKIVEKVKETGLKYMMAETVVYSREFLFIKDLYQQGELGKIQHLAASHPQDMDGWPSYWEAMIPMHYATHVVSPCLGLIDKPAESVSCFGSGTVRDDIAKKSGNRFAVETCHIRIQDSDVTAHIWRFLYDVARQYRESFDVYGTKKSFEWTLIEDEPHVLHTAKKPENEIPEKIEVPDFAHLLPQEIQKFTMPQQIHDAEAFEFCAGRRTRRFTSSSCSRDDFRDSAGSRSLAKRSHFGQLDLCRYLCSPVGGTGRVHHLAAGVYTLSRKPITKKFQTEGGCKNCIDNAPSNANWANILVHDWDREMWYTLFDSITNTWFLRGISMSQRVGFLIFVSLTWALVESSVPSAGLAQEAAPRPNIVVILCDDLGYGDLECFGHPQIKTPNLNQFAQDGVRLTSCYSAAPVCSPSRVGLLTGRSPNRAGVYDWIPASNGQKSRRNDRREMVHMRQSEVTLPRLLKKAGYATCMAGKWHCNSRF